MKKIIGLALIALLTLTGCQSKESTERKTTPNELTLNGDYVIPPTAHGNPFIGGYVGGGLDPYVQEALFAFTPVGDEHFKPHLAESFTQDDQKVTVTLKDDIKWSNGEKITTEDIATSYYMWVGKKQVWEFLEKIEYDDSNTMTFHFKVDSGLMANLLTDVRIQGSTAEYGKWAKQYEEIANTKRDWHSETNTFWMTEEGNQALETLNQELDEYQPKVTEMVGSGAYTVKKMTTDQASLVENEHFYTETGFEKLNIVRVTTPEIAANAMVEGTLDLHSGGMNLDLIEQMRKKIPAYTEFFLPEYSQMAVVFNVQKEFAKEKAFRQAMSYLLNREELLPLAEVGSLPSEASLSGLPLSLQKIHSVDEWSKKNLTQYDYAPEKAEKLLTEAGWKKDKNDQWIDENNQKVPFELTANSGWGSALLPGEAYVSALKDFGFDVTFKPMESAAYDAHLRNGEHSVAIEFAPPSNIIYANAYGTYEQLYRGRLWLFGLGADEKDGSLMLENAEGKEVNVIDLTKQLFVDSGEDYDATLKELMSVTAENALFIPYLEKGFPVRTLKSDIDLGVKADTLIQDPRFSGVAEPMFATLLVEGTLKDAIK